MAYQEKGYIMNKRLKYPLHSFLNRLTIPFLFIMFSVAYYFIYRDAYNDLWRIIGMISLTIFLIVVLIVFLYLFRALDYIIFDNEEIKICSLFRSNQTFQYSDYVWSHGIYSSVIETKKITIFTPKQLDGVCILVDTSRLGNCRSLNKNHILYCQSDTYLEKFLETKDMQYIDTNL
ncbi:MAG: hypothetical protein KKH92_03040 [Firmicutes bacterium]|nr:hypothetical protein [Bacillota bacterium]